MPRTSADLRPGSLCVRRLGHADLVGAPVERSLMHDAADSASAQAHGSVGCRSPALDTAYGIELPAGRSPATEVILMTAASRRRSGPGRSIAHNMNRMRDTCCGRTMSRFFP